MRKLSILASLLLVLALTTGYAVAAPSTSASKDVTLAGDEDGGKGAEAKKDKDNDDRSYRAKLASRGAPKASAKPKEKPKYKPWKEVVGEAEKHEGLFDVYTKDEDVYFAVKKDQLDKPFVTFMSLSKGIGARFVLGGLPITGSVMFDFHRDKDHLQVRMLNTNFRASGDKALEESIDLSYGNSMLFNLEIASEEKGNLLVEMNDVFLSDISDVGYWLQLALEKPVRLDSKKMSYRKVKAFPENVEVEALLTYSPGDRRGLDLPQVPDPRFIEIGVHYSIHALPEHPMKPRLADDRVGYFLTPHKDFSRDKDDTFFVYYINRWRLEKKDPSAAMSEPVKPITYYIDTTIPEQYRKYVKEGIEMWQTAYEAAGFKNAIIAKDVGDDPDYDAEDARYNTIRWIISDEPSFGAIGPSRVDPRTGEILDADILMEQNMIAGFRKVYRRYAGPTPTAMMEMDPMLFYLQDPKENPDVANKLELLKRISQNGALCTLGQGFAENMGFGEIAMLMQGAMEPGMEVPEEFVGQAIKFVTAHEVGHTLGLRHNFKSSISTPYAELNDKAAIDKIGMTGSVMDYAAPNVARTRAKQGYYYTSTVGTYDQWAITYGYMPIAGDKTPEQEYMALEELAGQASDKSHAYGTDEDTYPAGALDPYSAIWDLSDDPLAWAKERMGICQDVLTDGKLAERVVSDGDDYVPLRNAVMTVLTQEYIAATRAVRYVGSQYTTRSHRGDNGDKPFTPMSAAKQREAMEFVAKYALSKDAFTIDPTTLNYLQDNKQWDWQNNLFDFGRRFDFPLLGWVGAFQYATVAQLLSPLRLQRMHDAEYKQDDPYKVSEMFRTLTGSIWYDNMVPSGRTAAMQRNLQRIYLDQLIRMTVQPPSMTPWESVALARLNLERLRSRIQATYQQKGLSDEANAHLGESLARIDRALDAKLESSF